LTNLALKIKSPVAIGVGGSNKVCLDMVRKVLNQHLKREIKLGRDLFNLLKSDLVLFETDQESQSVFDNTDRSLLVITAAGNIPPRSEVFASKKKKVKPDLRLARKLSPSSLLMVNYDDETVREIVEDERVDSEVLNFGLSQGAEVRATDLRINEKGTSFKLNYQGNTVPVWLKNLVGKRQVYAALVSCALGVKLGINLVDVTQSLKLYPGVKGEGQLIPGVNRTRILDDSANADPFSVDETLMILSTIKQRMEGKTQTEIRKIAVLGDVLKVGKYAVEAHQALGEKAAENVDLLFTVGPRAKFIGNEASIQGLSQDQIFHFNEEREAALDLQEKMEPGDLILVDGAAEMEMEKIVEEIKRV